MEPRDPRILFVLPNWLGDLIMSLPALDLLARAAGPVHVAVRRRWAPLLAGDPRVAELLVHERTGRHGGLGGVARLAAQWRRARPAAVLLGPPSLRVALAAFLADIPVRMGYRGDGRRGLLTRSLAAPLPRGTVHYSQEMLRLAQELLDTVGIAAANGSAGSAWPALPALRTAAAAELGSGPPAWAVCVGTTYGPAKSWPAERMAEFICLAVQRAGVRVLLVGDAAAADFVARMRARADVTWRTDPAGGAAVVDLVGRTDLPRVIALLKAARVFVGNDSGLMHLAAALGVPTIGLFGSSSARWTGPRGPRVEVVTATGFACQPCFRKTCNQPRFCLDTVTAERVFALAAAQARTSPGEVPS